MTIKPFSISYSKMGTFRRCKLKYDRQYVRGYYPKPSIGQSRGTAGHRALAEWHTHYNQEDALKAAWDSWYSEGLQNNDEWQLLETSLGRYFQYSISNKDTFVVVDAEQKFEIEYDVDGVPVVFNGYIDGIVQEKGRIWLLENKFYKRMESQGLDMDPQVSLYLLAAHLLKYDAQGVIYNMVRVADTKIAVTEPVVRKRIFRNPQGLKAIQADMLTQAREMLRYHKEGGVPYRNATKDCSWDCAFHAACLSLLDDGVENTQLLSSVSQQRRDDG